jgi:Asp23 family, cell envelope-related function
MALADPSERLPCGTKLAALITQVAEGTPAADPAHQAKCRYCQPSLGRIRELWSDVRALANEPVHAPRGLLDEVMTRVRGPAGAVTLPDATRGHTQVSVAVLAGVARNIAQAMPAVAFASVLAHAVGPGTVALHVRLVVAYGPSLPVLAAAVRKQIVADVRRLTGVQVTEVEVSVDDLAVPDT